MKTLINDKRWEGFIFRYKVRGREYSNINFRELVIQYASFQDCIFDRCDFKNCYLGFNVKYKNCAWKNCRFHGRYMSFGGDSLFEDCQFKNVTIQSASTDGMVLRNCSITGNLSHMIWRGESSGTLKKMIIDNCDFSGASFANINIYAGINFDNSILPAAGIRIFKNHGGSFSKALREASEDLVGDDKSLLLTLGNEDCFSLQDPVVFDIPLINSMLKSENSIYAFNMIAERFEIT